MKRLVFVIAFICICIPSAFASQEQDFISRFLSAHEKKDIAAIGEWQLVTLAYNLRRMANLAAAA